MAYPANSDSSIGNTLVTFEVDEREETMEIIDTGDDSYNQAVALYTGGARYAAKGEGLIDRACQQIAEIYEREGGTDGGFAKWCTFMGFKSAPNSIYKVFQGVARNMVQKVGWDKSGHISKIAGALTEWHECATVGNVDGTDDTTRLPAKLCAEWMGLLHGHSGAYQSRLDRLAKRASPLVWVAGDAHIEYYFVSQEAALNAADDRKLGEIVSRLWSDFVPPFTLDDYYLHNDEYFYKCDHIWSLCDPSMVGKTRYFATEKAADAAASDEDEVRIEHLKLVDYELSDDEYVMKPVMASPQQGWNARPDQPAVEPTVAQKPAQAPLKVKPSTPRSADARAAPSENQYPPPPKPATLVTEEAASAGDSPPEMPSAPPPSTAPTAESASTPPATEPPTDEAVARPSAAEARYLELSQQYDESRRLADETIIDLRAQVSGLLDQVVRLEERLRVADSYPQQQIMPEVRTTPRIDKAVRDKLLKVAAPVVSQTSTIADVVAALRGCHRVAPGFTLEDLAGNRTRGR